MFTALAIITLLKYKTKLNFCFKNERIPDRVTYSFHLFCAITLAGCVLLPLLTVDTHISDKGSHIMNFTIQTTYLIFLSLCSLLLSYRVASNFNLINH